MPDFTPYPCLFPTRILQKLNVLLVSSRAFDAKNGMNPLSEEEGQAIMRGLQTAKQEGHIAVEELKPATFEAFEKYVLEHNEEETPQIIHFDGHGCFGILCNAISSDGRSCRTFHFKIDASECKKCGSSLPKPQGFLLFEDGLGGVDYISARQIAATVRLANSSNRNGYGIALVVLSACKSSLSLIEDSVFNGVAQSLISHQVPSAVGMSFAVNVVSATNFADRFYRALGKKHPLALAMSWGRQAMGFDSNQWYRPVLYLRWQDNEGGQLFTSGLRENQNEGQWPTDYNNDFPSTGSLQAQQEELHQHDKWRRDSQKIELQQQENRQDTLAQLPHGATFSGGVPTHILEHLSSLPTGLGYKLTEQRTYEIKVDGSIKVTSEWNLEYKRKIPNQYLLMDEE